MANAHQTTRADELAAPLDLLLTSATQPLRQPDDAQRHLGRFAANLAQQPGRGGRPGRRA